MSAGPVEVTSAEDCPCCQRMPRSTDDFDRALTLAFLSGVSARDMNVPIGRALCPKHGRLAADAMLFVLQHDEAAS